MSSRRGYVETEKLQQEITRQCRPWGLPDIGLCAVQQGQCLISLAHLGSMPPFMFLAGRSQVSRMHIVSDY